MVDDLLEGGATSAAFLVPEGPVYGADRLPRVARSPYSIAMAGMVSKANASSGLSNLRWISRERSSTPWTSTRERRSLVDVTVPTP